MLLFSKSNSGLQFDDLTHTLPIPSLQRMKILGVTYTSDLKWDAHVSDIIGRASQRIYVLKQLRSLINRPGLIKIYKALIVSVLEYCSPVMVGMNKKNCDKIEKVNRRCHRIICGNDCICECFVSIEERRHHHAEVLFLALSSPSNILQNLIPHTLPRSNHFFINNMNTEKRQKAFIPYMSVHLNATR